MSEPLVPLVPVLTRHHHRRLREVYRSAGWPCQDMLEVELLAAGQIERMRWPEGHETLRVTDAGIATLARVFATNKAARSPHEALVEQVALAMERAGRLAWRGLSLRARVPISLTEDAEVPPCHAVSEPLPGSGWADGAVAGPGHAWVMACPDVFSIRRSTVEAYLEPVVHEIKVSRADLLGDLRKPAKRAAYLDMASACWYVLGQDARGRPIGTADDVPPECGVLLVQEGRLVVAREAPRRALERLPLQVWMALAQAGAPLRADNSGQAAF
ncbi:MAG TPA: hypothetical protein PKC60_15140 [Hydrogenophaga sp.]|uniref:hypothetical protein n=1 Tax=Hydrogenophaga sp. TaxID=1904254 RepID=UPI002C72CA63|nr:hypothetical protein [Hydrogenophaga sp.]HMN94560.1 hypothetical protein [Hydrogenophaga sp.]HMP10109.1 hypothetical protein [Hydrogenophaga sp.]